jgi:hypothetical protein
MHIKLIIPSEKKSHSRNSKTAIMVSLPFLSTYLMTSGPMKCWNPRDDGKQGENKYDEVAPPLPLPPPPPAAAACFDGEDPAESIPLPPLLTAMDLMTAPPLTGGRTEEHSDCSSLRPVLLVR